MNIRAIFQVKFWLIQTAVTRQHSWANNGQAGTGGAKLFMLWTTTSRRGRRHHEQLYALQISAAAPSFKGTEGQWLGITDFKCSHYQRAGKPAWRAGKSSGTSGQKSGCRQNLPESVPCPPFLPWLGREMAEGQGLLSLRGRAMTLSRNV